MQEINKGVVTYQKRVLHYCSANFNQIKNIKFNVIENFFDGEPFLNKTIQEAFKKDTSFERGIKLEQDFNENDNIENCVFSVIADLDKKKFYLDQGDISLDMIFNFQFEAEKKEISFEEMKN
ncbi:hypothetical protein [Spiroplasma tabanidicola]|uniref:hypothetical protein n=1 Tax=Spiroplasma tabanidicola TaxID=324079 RepID=UPI00147830EB|nr:hypothetical protein [Spiroplasma tabanidicola]